MNKGRISDTLPRPGRVTQVCKEWLVLEDGALAYQLQQEEVSKHLSGNKIRNAIVREDFPHALMAQQEAEEEARKLARLAEEQDRTIAKELSEQLTKKDQKHKLAGDMNEVGLPLAPFSYSPQPHPIACCSSSSSVSHGIEIENGDDDDEDEQWPPPPPPEVEDDADIKKREQERLDQELAARLQQEEELSEELDRKLAIEAQDEEIARLLQDKEKAKVRKIKERARAKKLQATNGLMTTPQPSPIRPSQIPNIAMAIDPTYSPNVRPDAKGRSTGINGGLNTIETSGPSRLAPRRLLPLNKSSTTPNRSCPSPKNSPAPRKKDIK